MKTTVMIKYVSAIFIIQVVNCHLEQTMQVSSLPVGYKEHGNVPQKTSTG